MSYTYNLHRAFWWVGWWCRTYYVQLRNRPRIRYIMKSKKKRTRSASPLYIITIMMMMPPNIMWHESPSTPTIQDSLWGLVQTSQHNAWIRKKLREKLKKKAWNDVECKVCHLLYSMFVCGRYWTRVFGRKF